jgi:folate-binding Fe-S cluster repair protein YgfZ
VNRTLRVLELDGDELPGADDELTLDGKVVGRVTSAAAEDGHVVALAYVRVDVPREVELRVGERGARQLDLPSARP